jgi:hypothetical protein
VNGHCFLHLEARQVVSGTPTRQFVAWPEDMDDLHALAGHDQSFATTRILGNEYVLFAYPRGD